MSTPVRSPEAVAYHVLAHGMPYTRQCVYEGTVETGPYATVYRGFRMGPVQLELSPTGETLLWGREQLVDTPYGPTPVNPVQILDSEDLNLRLRRRIFQEQYNEAHRPPPAAQRD